MTKPRNTIAAVMITAAPYQKAPMRRDKCVRALRY